MVCVSMDNFWDFKLKDFVFICFIYNARYTMQGTQDKLQGTQYKLSTNMHKN